VLTIYPWHAQARCRRGGVEHDSSFGQLRTDSARFRHSGVSLCPFLFHLGFGAEHDSRARLTSTINTGLSGYEALYVFALAINPATPSTLYAGTYGGGVFQSTNSGGSWSAVNTGLSGDALSVHALAIDPATPSTLYAGTDANRHAHRDTDGDADQYTDSDAECNVDEYANCHADADRNEHFDRNTDYYCDSHSDQHADPDTDRDPDEHPNGHAH